MSESTDKINLSPWTLIGNDKNIWTCLVIGKDTGIVYHHFCRGIGYWLPNHIEGFAIPIPFQELWQQLFEFFQRFGGASAYANWTQQDKDELSAIVNKIVIYRSQSYTSKNLWVWDDWIVSFLSSNIRLFQYKDGKVICNWENEKDQGKIEFFNLELDLERWDEAVAGWIPVETGFGPGVLMFENYD
jgi:hypothetical protein